MRLLTTLCLTLSLASAMPALAATPSETAAQVRAKWATASNTYLTSSNPYQSQATYAATVKLYTDAMNKTGATLEQYLNLKLAVPATPADKLTPVIDQLYVNMNAQRAARAKATGPLVTIMGTALTQHNEAVQTALINMR